MSSRRKTKARPAASKKSANRTAKNAEDQTEKDAEDHAEYHEELGSAQQQLTLQIYATKIHQSLVGKVGLSNNTEQDPFASRRPDTLSKGKEVEMASNQAGPSRNQQGLSLNQVPEKTYLHPLRLDKWENFFDQQALIQSEVLILVGPDEQQFKLPDGAGEVPPHPGFTWGNKLHLRQVHQQAVEGPVASIIEVIRKHPDAAKFNLGTGIRFKHHVNWLAVNGREVRNRRTDMNYGLNRAAPVLPSVDDLLCVYRTTDKDNKNGNNPGDLLYFVDFQSVVNITMTDIRLGLKTMEVALAAEHVAAGSSDEVYLNYVGTVKHVIKAVARLYHYMLEAGVSFAYMTNGPTFVFLNINWHNPTILKYKIIEPKAMVEQHKDFEMYCTATIQVLTFTLLSLSKDHAGQDARQRVMEKVSKRPGPQQHHFRGRKMAFDNGTHNDTIAKHIEPLAYPEVDMDPFWRLEQLQMADATGYGTSVPRIFYPERDQAAVLNEWCTQRCLYGLKYGLRMDGLCPNVDRHVARKHEDGEQLGPHTLTHMQFIEKLTAQMRRMLDQGVVRLDKQGKRGVYFQITDLTHGYVFLAKGTVCDFAFDFVTELMAYRQAADLQGEMIPVHLGLIDLFDDGTGAGASSSGRFYHADHKVYLRHFALLSYAGRPVGDFVRPRPGLVFKRVEEAFANALRALQDRNLAHGNLDVRKLLYDPTTGRHMMVDLTRALIGKKPDCFLTVEEKMADVNLGVPFTEADFLPVQCTAADWLKLDEALRASTREGDDLTGCGLLDLPA